MSPGTLAIGFLATLILAGALSYFGFRRALAGGGDEVHERMNAYSLALDAGPRRDRGRNRPRLGWLRLRLNSMLAGLASESLGLQLARANWRLSVPEFLSIRLAASVGALLLGWLLFQALVSGVALAVIAYLVPSVLLRRSISRRQIDFGKQLSDVLALLAGAVRAGYSLLQALEVVVREVKPPASEEFGRVLKEVGLGLQLPRALRNVCARMENSDLDLMVTAIEIQYQVGGNMATMLSAVTETIRERIRLFGEVRVITTQQRYTSYLLTGLPIFVGALMFLLNPSYMAILLEPPWICFPIGAGLGIVAGHFVIQRIIKLEV